MGSTSEAVAEKYNIPRERQDEFAVQSHQKAKAAQDDGRLAEEIVPIKVRKVTPAEGDKPEITEEVVISKDEGIRPQTTMESLAKLKTVFKENGTGTAGNSSQISDGASAVTLCRRDVAEKLGLKIMAKWVGSSVVGVPPIIMGESLPGLALVLHFPNAGGAHAGVGPAYAVPPLLERYGITKDDVDLFELNEGESLRALPSLRTLLAQTDSPQHSFRFTITYGHGHPPARSEEGQPEGWRNRTRRELAAAVSFRVFCEADLRTWYSTRSAPRELYTLHPCLRCRCLETDQT